MAAIKRRKMIDLPSVVFRQEDEGPARKTVRFVTIRFAVYFWIAQQMEITLAEMAAIGAIELLDVDRSAPSISAKKPLKSCYFVSVPDQSVKPQVPPDRPISFRFRECRPAAAAIRASCEQEDQGDHGANALSWDTSV
jgi:hypothetical protein